MMKKTIRNQVIIESLKFLIFFGLIFTPSLSSTQCFVNESRTIENQYRTYSSSGNGWIDQTFYQQNQYLATTMGLSVQVGYYDDSQTGPNAFAMPANNYYQDGQTYFGLNLLNNYLVTQGSNASYYVLWILAHEYAHILQFKKGGMIWEKTKWNELQADFIAGCIAAKHIVETNNYSLNNSNFIGNYVQVSTDFFYSLGDTNFGSSGHHGTPRERDKAFKAGLEYAVNKGVLETYNNGYNNYYVLNVEKAWYFSKKYIDGL